MRTDYVGGETITIAWTETINHQGFFVVSLDPDGEDFDGDGDGMPDYPAHPDYPDSGNGDGSLVLAQIDDDDMTRTLDVTLPDIDCEDCTLQLVQMMGERMPTAENPLAYLYFRCADITITSSGGGEMGDDATDEGAGGADGAGGMAGDDMATDDTMADDAMTDDETMVDPTTPDEGAGGGAGTDVTDGTPTDTTGDPVDVTPDTDPNLDGVPPTDPGTGDTDDGDTAALPTDPADPSAQTGVVDTGDDTASTTDPGVAGVDAPGDTSTETGTTDTAGATDVTAAGSPLDTMSTDPTASDGSSSSDSGGCAVSQARSRASSGWLLAMALALGAVAMRRRS
jgi:hypothetical protein